MAPAQAAPPQQAPQIKQIALTDKQIESALAATKEMDPITEKLPQDAKPDPKITAQLDGIAKKNGFASYDEYNSVVDNISLVLGGFDPATKKYWQRSRAQTQVQIQIQEDVGQGQKEDSSISTTRVGPVGNKIANIDLVAKYYDKLAAAPGDDNNHDRRSRKAPENLGGFFFSAPSVRVTSAYEAIVAQLGDLDSTPAIRCRTPTGSRTSWKCGFLRKVRRFR